MNPTLRVEIIFTSFEIRMAEAAKMTFRFHYSFNNSSNYSLPFPQNIVTLVCSFAPFATSYDNLEGALPS